VKLSHFDDQGLVRMVNVSDKTTQYRTAIAEGHLRVNPETLGLVEQLELPKGSPFEIARIAGIQAAKQTPTLIPLCHSLNLDYIDIEIKPESTGFAIRSQVICQRSTGVEMEALTAVSIAGLTLYDMCKAVDPTMTLEGIRLVKKTKGKE
jgi:cyclic pyranopterin phosphate synthase